MTNIKTKTAGRIAVAAVLSMGLTAGAVSIASASSDHGTRVSDHDHGFSWNLQGRIEGVVSSYTAGSSIAVVSRGATTATTYTLTSATTVTGLAAGASMLNDHVVLVMSTTTPATVLSIKVETPKSAWIEGVVSSYTAGSSIAVVSRGATTATTYTLTSATTVTGLAAGASMLNDHVVLVMSTTTPATVLSIKVETPKSNCNGAKDGTNGNGANGNFKASDDNLSRHGFAYQGFSHGNSSRHGNFRR
jgi:hypothetical protein